MEIKRLTNRYYVAMQKPIYGYGTTADKAVRSCLRQLEREIFNPFTTGTSNFSGDNIPYGYNNEGGYLTDKLL